jgi:phosphoribosylglycinamide formyltransferase-1
MIRVAVLCSTGGAVFATTARESPYLRDRIALVVADRECGALEAAERLGYARDLLPWQGREPFGRSLAATLARHRIDLCVCFFTRLLDHDFVDAHAGRIVNFHPSLLPAFPGMHGFEDSLAFGARFVGSTVHFVDAGMDTGPPILQACCPCDLSAGVATLRHRVFVQQCKSLVQTVRWFEQGRIHIEGRRCQVDGANYAMGEFAPALDFDDAAYLRI